MKTRIVLVGYGQMGRELYQAAADADCEVVGIHDVDDPYSNAMHEGYDVAIDFTEPSAVMNNVKIAGEHGKNIVIGTTGWHHEMDRIHAIQERSGIGVLYASNFSIGVQLFFKLVAEAGAMIDRVDDYDAMIHEWHHKRKKDSPSGTARTAAEIMVNALGRKQRMETEAQHGVIDPQSLHVSSSRVGDVIGRHLLTIDGPNDTIEVQHSAKNRTGFVKGALASARWLKGKTGMHDFSDVFMDVFAATP